MVSVLVSVPFIIILVVILVLILVLGNKIESTEGGEELVKNIYLYLVLFATLMMTIGGSVGVFMAVADIIAPTPYYQSFEEYRHMQISRPYPEERDGLQEATLSEEELRQRYEAAVLSHRETQVARATNSLIKSFGWIVVPLPVFIFFQRRLLKKDPLTS